MHPKIYTTIVAMLLFSFYSCVQDKEEKDRITRISSNQIQFLSGKSELIEGFGEQDVVTYIIVRHAEKDLNSGNDPSLTEEGKKRAESLLEIIKDFQIDKVCFTGNMKRTYETALPSLNYFKCGYESFSKNAVQTFFINTLEAYKGKRVLIIGNTNTIPMMLNTFSNHKKFEDIDENEYDNLFIVTARSTNDVMIQQFKY